MKHPKYPHVFEPIQYGPIRLKNRIIGLPMMNGLSTPDGRVTKEMVTFIAARARAGAGLFYIGDSELNCKYGMTHYTPLDLSYEGNTNGFTDLADAAHCYGMKLGVEISHGGYAASELINNETGRRLAVSPCPAKPGDPARAHDAIVMDQALMDEVKAAFVDDCVRLMNCGFDAVMLHCAHGWLLHQFLSASTNHRTDQYGGSLENRMRYPLEVIQAVYEAVGHRMAIDVRVSTGGDLSPNGEADIQEVIAFLKAASPYITGANVSVMDRQLFETSEYMISSYYLPHMCNTGWAVKVKKADTGVLISNSGSVVTVAEAEELLASGQCDLVGMGRAQLVDDVVSKACRGQEENTRPCLRCAHCTDRLFYYNTVRCAVNPLLGKEYLYPIIIPATRKKKVLVVGGGPAGMEAAKWLVERGHTVTLCEQSYRLGGMLHVAGALPAKYDMRRYTQWQIRQTEQCGARIMLNCQVTPAFLQDQNPDAVVLAIGSKPSMPSIPGIDSKNMVFAADVDTGKVTCGKRVVIMGAGFTGSECAIPLAQNGHEVTLVDRLPQEAYDNAGWGAQAWMSILRLHREYGVKNIMDAKITAITEAGICYTRFGEAGFIEADTVVNALGLVVDQEQVDTLRYVIPETYLIGDCLGETMNIDTAIASAFACAMDI